MEGEEQRKTRKEDQEMLVAVYDFEATIPQTLSFKKDDNFVFHSSNNINKNWWSIINSIGKVGYIPSNYVSVIKVRKGKIVDFINTAIENLSVEISKAGGSDKQLEAMKELISRKQEIIQRRRSRSRSSSSDKKEKLFCSKSLPDSDNISSCEDGSQQQSSSASAGPPLMRISVSETKFPSSEGQSSSESRSESIPQSSAKKVKAPCDPLEEEPRRSSHPAVATPPNVPDKSNQLSSEVVNVMPASVYLLIHQVRNQTGLSHEESRVAAGVVGEGLLDILPSEATSSLETFLELLHANAPPLNDIYDDTRDAVELRAIVSHLRTAREDAQQRSWHLWDDEASIKQQITQMFSILTNADPAISQRVLKQGNYEDVTMLVDYYQMEERLCIRLLLLRVFGVLCSLDKVVTSILLNSVLPMELAREMQSNRNSVSKIEKPAELLTIIFSTGEPMPITHLDQLGGDFVKAILEIIETEEMEDIEDTMVTLLLSYNLQFKLKSPTNITLQALSEMKTAKTFTEKIMLLINREDDPIAKLKVHNPPQHSVLKLLKDVFASTATAKFCYTNDIKVLVEIIVREITDLPPNSRRRSDYLELCQLVMSTCESCTYEHRLDDLKNLFHHILNEETPPVQNDRNVVRQLIESHPLLFG